MAQNYKYNQVTTKKFAIKGQLSADGKTIFYVDGDKEEKKIEVGKCFEKFGGQMIEVTIANKEDEDLTGKFEEE